MSRVGVLRQPFRLETPETASDGRGGETVARWTQVGGILWGSLEELAADERLTGGGQRATATHRVECHYRADVTHAHRLRLPGRPGLADRIFHVETVTDIGGRGRRLRLEVAEEAPR